jgi:YidC/Oxa1 family membrane protein insertase
VRSMLLAFWILDPIYGAMGRVLAFFYSVVASYGVAIALLTVTVRIFLIPLTTKQVKSQQAMQRIQPELKRLQAKYKNDRQKLNEEMMKFYKENKVNPLASCLPLAAQLPVFLSLFYMLRKDLRHDICPDINPPDIPNPQPCGEGGEAAFFFIPDLTNNATGAVLVALIVMYVGSQLASTLLMSTTTDKTQRMIFLALPFFFVIFVINFPAGLLVYWITTNLWTIVQQMIVRKRLGPMRPPGSEPAPGLGELLKQARGQTAPAQPEERSRAKDRELVAPAGGAPKPKARPTAPPPAPPRKKKKRSGRRR